MPSGIGTPMLTISTASSFNPHIGRQCMLATRRKGTSHHCYSIYHNVQVRWTRYESLPLPYHLFLN